MHGTIYGFLLIRGLVLGISPNHAQVSTSSTSMHDKKCLSLVTLSNLSQTISVIYKKSQPLQTDFLSMYTKRILVRKRLSFRYTKYQTIM